MRETGRRRQIRHYVKRDPCPCESRLTACHWTNPRILLGGHSLNSMRATVIATVPENGVQLEDVRHAAIHRGADTTQADGGWGCNRQKMAGFLDAY